MDENKKSGYGSRIGLLCVLVAGSVGTGNMWRYPRLVCTYGGAFVVATIVGLILIAIPLVMNENFMGRASRHSAPGAFRDLLGPQYTWMGTFATMCYFMMHCNYTVILAWCVRYTFMSATGSYFGVEDKMALFNSVASKDLWTGVCWVGIVVLAWFFMKRQSIMEKMTKFIVPAMFVILIIMIGFSMTREGGIEGYKYSFSFTLADLVNPTIWLEALTQDFWSLGSGTMLCVTMAKFAHKEEDIVVNSNVQAFGDSSFAMLATLSVLPCIFSFAGSTEEAVALAKSGNNGLTFVGLCNLFESVAGGRILGTLFFACLVFAAFSSVCVAGTVFAGPLIDCGIKRSKAVAIVLAGHLIIALPCFLNQDVLSNQDTVWGFGIFIGGTFSGLFAMKYGAKKIRRMINAVSDKQLGKAFEYMVGLLAPIACIIIMVTWLIQSIGWDPEWYNPFRTSSTMTLLIQWGIALIICLALNKTINRKTQGVFYDPDSEEFPEIPDQIMEQV